MPDDAPPSGDGHYLPPGNGQPQQHGYIPPGDGPPQQHGYLPPGYQAQPQARSGPQAGPRRPLAARQKSAIWIIAIVAVVVILLRAHRINQTEVIWFCILIPSLILHEIAHGWVALAFGDDTAKRAGRLSLNPVRHVDPIGTLLVPAIMVLSGWGFFGWAKPVPVTVRRLRSPRNQGVLVSLAGPFTNIVLAALAGVLFWLLFTHSGPLTGPPTLAERIVFFAGVVNLWVAFFNLIPIPPLDGSALLERLLPGSWWPGYLRIRPYGLLVIFGGLLLLGTAHVYPLQPIFDHMLSWWTNLLN